MATTLFYSTNTNIDIELLKNELETCGTPGPYVVVKITPGPQGIETRTVVEIVGTIIDPSSEYTQIQDIIDNHISSKDPTTTIVTSSVDVQQNLHVEGSETIFNTNTVTIADHLIQVNTGVTGPEAVLSGVEVYRGPTGDAAYIAFDERTSPGKFKLGQGLSNLSEVITASNFSSLITGINRNQLAVGTTKNILFNGSDGRISESSDFQWNDSTKELRLKNGGVTVAYINPTNSVLLSGVGGSTILQGEQFYVRNLDDARKIYYNGTSPLNDQLIIGASIIELMNSATNQDKFVIDTSGTNDSVTIKSNTISLQNTSGAARLVISEALANITVSADILMNTKNLVFTNNKGVYIRNAAGTTDIQCLVLDPSNNTSVNAATGQNLHLCINQSSQWFVNATSGYANLVANKTINVIRGVDNNKLVQLCGGLSGGTSDGASVSCYGIGYSGAEGRLLLYSGNNANSYVHISASGSSSGSVYIDSGSGASGAIRFRPNGIEKWLIDNAGALTGLSGSSLGSSGTYVPNAYINTADINYFAGGNIYFNTTTYLKMIDDTRVFQLCGGSSGSVSNGAYINLYGIGYTSYEGKLYLYAGNHNNSSIELNASSNIFSTITLQCGSGGTGISFNRGTTTEWRINGYDGDLICEGTRYIRKVPYYVGGLAGDTSDNRSIQFGGGHLLGTSYGAWVTLYGNDNTTAYGNLVLSAGNSAVGGYGRIQFGTSGSFRWYIENTGDIYPTANNTYSIGSYPSAAVHYVVAQHVIIGNWLLQEDAGDLALYYYNGSSWIKKAYFGSSHGFLHNDVGDTAQYA